MTYRSAPEAPRPVVLAAPRSRVLLAEVLGVALAAAVPSYFVSDGSALSCDRARGTCTLTTWHAARTLGSSESLPLASIARAEVARTRDSEGSELRGVALVVDGKARVVGDAYQGFGFAAMDAWVASVNAFLGDPARPSFDIERASSLPLVVWAVVSALAVGLWLAACARVTVDRGRGLVRIRRWPWSRRIDVALASVAGVEVRTRPVGDKEIAAVWLLRKDAEPIALTSDGARSIAGKRRFAAAIERALAGD